MSDELPLEPIYLQENDLVKKKHRAENLLNFIAAYLMINLIIWRNLPLVWHKRLKQLMSVSKHFQK